MIVSGSHLGLAEWTMRQIHEHDCCCIRHLMCHEVSVFACHHMQSLSWQASARCLSAVTGVYSFCFAGHAVFVSPLLTSMAKPKEYTFMLKVSFATALTLYVTMAVLGVACFGQDVRYVFNLRPQRPHVGCMGGLNPMHAGSYMFERFDWPQAADHTQHAGSNACSFSNPSNALDRHCVATGKVSTDTGACCNSLGGAHSPAC